MSGHGCHVYGPHDHELEHAQQGGHGGGHGESGSKINQIVLFTAVIATVGAVFGHMGGATHANAGLHVAIAMATIVLLTQKNWLEYVITAAGGIRLVVGALASLHV